MGMTAGNPSLSAKETFIERWRFFAFKRDENQKGWTGFDS
ncbi:hypothetical protein M472_02405 [Sphingobacterium paucimobilis HER1398]|uniref:Uncharacterized protein n=1 Tax=Sphingobacterium paucimobilis HER1398 TaxID=1346330 RepID=U2HQR1_9SPHI|nr:hypothetical protein M472_02405 [Sphingobacterium paucimobilis HER1398]